MRGWIGKTWIKATGWTITGSRLDVDKCVLIGAPHTSGWDAAYAIAYFWAFPGPFHFIAKKELFRPPLGPIWRWAGGIPVNRTRPQGLVDQMVHEFRTRDKLWLMLAPKGTREYRDYWKTGFYVIAHAARVPVVVGYLDFEHKEVGLSEPYMLTGDVNADMNHIRGLLAGKAAKRFAYQDRVALQAEHDERARERLQRVVDRYTPE